MLCTNDNYEKSELFFSFFLVAGLPLGAEFIHSGSLRLTSACCCCELLASVDCDCDDFAPIVDCHFLRSVWRPAADGWLWLTELSRLTCVRCWFIWDEVDGPTQLCWARTDCNTHNATYNIHQHHNVTGICFSLFYIFCTFARYSMWLLRGVINNNTNDDDWHGLSV